MKKLFLVLTISFLIFQNLQSQGILTPKGETHQNINGTVVRIDDEKTYGAGYSIVAKGIIEFQLYYTRSFDNRTAGGGIDVTIHALKSKQETPSGIAVNLGVQRLDYRSQRLEGLNLGSDFYYGFQVNKWYSITPVASWAVFLPLTQPNYGKAEAQFAASFGIISKFKLAKWCKVIVGPYIGTSTESMAYGASFGLIF
jgi:hypothetical protein